MPTLALNLPTGYTTTAKIRTQPRAGGSWSALIGPSSVASNVYSYTVPSGDLNVQLFGVSEQDGEPFNVRNGIAYLYQTWQQIDATIVVPPVVPSPITGLCNLVVSCANGPNALAGARVSAHLDAENNNTAAWLLARTVNSGVTDSSGNCVLSLVQAGQFTRGGVYRVRTYDPDGNLMCDRRVTMPNILEANLAALPDA